MMYHFTPFVFRLHTTLILPDTNNNLPKINPVYKYSTKCSS